MYESVSIPKSVMYIIISMRMSVYLNVPGMFIKSNAYMCTFAFHFHNLFSVSFLILDTIIVCVCICMFVEMIFCFNTL